MLIINPSLSRLCFPHSRICLRSHNPPVLPKHMTTSPRLPPSLGPHSVKPFYVRYPWLANCLMYGSLFTLAELIQQTITRKLSSSSSTSSSSSSSSSQDYDLASLGRYCVLGTGPQATMLHWWYVWLDRRYVGTTAAIVTKKLALDNVVISPPLFASFFIGMSLMEGEEDVFAECRDKMLPTLSASWVYWTPAMAINFLVVPAAARVAFVGLCSLVWTNFMLVIKKMDWEGMEAKKDDSDGEEEADYSQLQKFITKYVEQCLINFKAVSK